MNKVQSVIVSLLQEVDALLGEHHVRYSVFDRLAWDTVKFGRFHDRTYDAAIVVRGEDFRKTARLLAGHDRERRAVAFPEGEERKRWFSYADTQTTLIDLGALDNRACYNVSVTVLSAPHASLFSRERRCRASSGEEVVLPQRFFDDVGRAEFEGVSLCISQHYSELFDSLVGEGWQRLTWPHHINHVQFGVVASGAVPARELTSKAEDLGIDVADLARKWVDFERWQHDVYAPAEKRMKENNAKLGLFEERYRLYEKYHDAKPIIVERWKEGHTGAVEAALDDYLGVLERYYKCHAVTVYFDEELFAIAAALLGERGVASMGQLVCRIPDGHRAPLAFS